jgi:hypothetical protein
VPERFATRARRPSASRVVPRRVGFLSFGSISATFETWIGPSRSMTPASAFGLSCEGRWWRLMMFRPAT